MKSRTRIRDNPSIKTPLALARGFTWLKRLAPLLRPLLRRFNVNVARFEAELEKVDDLARSAREVGTVPDRFNKLFAARGWIVYDRLALDVMQAAIQKADAGGIDEAENYLVEHYTPETVEWGIQSMYAVEAFRPRIALAEKALADYAAERYHACIPVVLALLDGMINEVHQKALGSRRGISAEGVKLEAWDTFAGHSSGLARLVEIFQTGRRKTNTEPLRLPYRNGIMHGIDLGYDTRIVAAKTWAALFAAREWAVKAEQKQLQPPPPPPKQTFKEFLNTLRETAARSKRWEAHKRWREEWKPRPPFEPGLPLNSRPDEFGKETPEYALAEFLQLWRASNYGKMAELIAMFQGENGKRGPARVREVFRDRKLESFVLRLVKDDVPAITEIVVDLKYRRGNETVTRSANARLMFTGADGRPALLFYEPGRWCVLNWALDQ